MDTLSCEDGFVTFGEESPDLVLNRTEVWPSGSNEYEMAIRFSPWCKEKIIKEIEDPEGRNANRF